MQIALKPGNFKETASAAESSGCIQVLHVNLHVVTRFTLNCLYFLYF